MVALTHIINQEQGTLHLGMLPKDMAPIVILVSHTSVLSFISRYLDSVETSKAQQGFAYTTGQLGTKRISIVSTGTGPNNMDIILQELDALAHNQQWQDGPLEVRKQLKLFHLGTSHAIQDNIGPGQIIASSMAIGLDNLLHYYQHSYNAEEQFLLHAFEQHTHLQQQGIRPYIAECSVRLLNLFTPGIPHGVVVSCPGFFAPQGRSVRLVPAFPQLIEQMATFASSKLQALHTDMQIAAFYGLGKLTQHQCIAISTVVDSRAPQQEQMLLPMIESCLAVIKNI